MTQTPIEYPSVDDVLYFSPETVITLNQYKTVKFLESIGFVFLRDFDFRVESSDKILSALRPYKTLNDGTRKLVVQ